jgi:Uma2 family endonuclease
MQHVPLVNLGRPATYDDLVNVPEHLVAEIVDGDLWTSPRPAPRHSFSHASLTAVLHAPYDQGRGGPGGWWILTEPEIHLGPDVVVPDLAGWRRERMPRLPDTAFFAQPPDWLCEIVSPSTARLDRAKKRPLYARQGVQHVWILDLPARTLEVLRLESGRWTIAGSYADLESVRAEPFGAVALELALVWAE